jgi:dipeptidyl aminopeptidase/acylaminoacyl peptidase
MKRVRRPILITVLLFTAVLISLSQDKKALSVTDMMKFRQVQSPTISNDGNWVVHAAVPDRGNPEVLVYSTDGKAKFTIHRGEKPVISNDGQWISVVHAVPAKERLKSASATESKSDEGEGPKAGLILLNTSTGEQVSFENIKSSEFSNDSKWLFYHDVSNNTKDTTSAGENSKNGDKPGSAKKNMGTPLNIMSLDHGSTVSFPFVTKFAIDSLSRFLAFVVSDSSGTGNGVHMVDLSNSTGESFPVFTDSSAWADNLSWNNRSGQLAFLAGIPGKKDKRENADLFLWSPGEKDSKTVLKDQDLAAEWKIYHTNKLQWSKDGKRLFLGIKPESEIILPEEEKNDSLPDLFDTESILADRALDVWHWNDPYINPQQKKRWKQEKDRTYTGVYYAEKGNFVPLADKEVPAIRTSESVNYLLGSSNIPYARRVTWDGRINDYYLVDLISGKKKLAVKEQQHTVRLSPDGKFLVYYKHGDWHLVESATLNSRNLTEHLDVSFEDEDWDYPEDVPGYGVADWLDGSGAVLIYDKYDIWQFPTSGDQPMCLTEGKGRREKYQFRIKHLDTEKRYLGTGETCFLTAYHDTQKYTALYSMKAGTKGVTKIVEEPKKYTLLAKSKEADKILYSRQSYTEFPDLWVTDLKFRKPVKLTDVNPQTAEFAWGEAELVEWTSVDGIPLQGILIKPGNYEPGKKYPVLVYYYRFFSNRLFDFNHVAVNHRPCFPFYASNGYAIFLPDIRFDIGNPGYSATKCLVPGVQKIINMGVANPDGICLHGHSWSGYQTAFAITQTDIFTCAIAGAPVSNMTSAYSGIRWESGLARQFQYEKSQSRIGGSLWEVRDKYIENSPVFFADRINTPLLIQFGDEDGAVPWYQGIELYLAMRRLDKDCVFLQYRGEPHHLKKYANKLDYTLKFKAYLDHYLKGEPAPEWLDSGVPYKGK